MPLVVPDPLAAYPRTVATYASDGDALSRTLASAAALSVSDEEAERLDRAGAVWNPPSGTLERLIVDSAPEMYLPLTPQRQAVDYSGLLRSGTKAGNSDYANGHASGFHPGSIFLDGTNARITTTYNPFSNGGSRTFAGWARRDTTSGNRVLFGGSNANGVQPILRLVSGGSNVQFIADSALTGAGQFASWTSAWPALGAWTHWALTFNEPGDTASLYINGAVVSAQGVTAAFNAAAGTISVGSAAGGAEWWLGLQAHFGVWSRALTATEILAMYQSGLRWIG